MATIKELINDVNTYLNPNIDIYCSDKSITYKINNTWIDLIEDKYFSIESQFILQKIENTLLRSEKPILIVTRLHHIFRKRLNELLLYREHKLKIYLSKYHRTSVIDFEDSKVQELYKKQCKVIITQKMIEAETNPKSELFTLKSFLNLPLMQSLHKKEKMESKKLLFHLDTYVQEVNKIFMVLDEILYDYENFKIVIYDDYFKSYYKINTRKIQLDLKLKDVAYFYHFVLETGFFKFHPERKMNKKLLINFFENNFMYTDQKSNKPKEFINLIKHASDAAKESVRFKDSFIKEMTNRYEEFSKINLQKVERYYIPD